ncbi:MAG TPA: ATP-binding protein [Lysinibacillus sp.]|uniref:sensor histidine kinase n=1 Tax=Lysinibacillus TaxID=400634 RepID=UPI00068E4DF1|nr:MULTISPECIES: ATP-binding protein [Lysinibacillus]MEE3809763.1 ATP-binding protein [Lysinibacillus fusiformis]HBT72877.1 ATP-binding protein [Lysinibacillus sp.]KUF37287.1 histidine kinase [Lysinibacillus sp. F5]WCH47876.1 ATP-binding protein [Lysinibacillus sp. OF-1]WKT77444.1 ATP-binding protein [Lysinibacillus fusiformis]
MQSKLSMTRASLTWIFIIAVLTAIGSEIKIMPFANTTFRFGLGTIIFFLCTLLKPTPIILAGIATSIVTTIFRVINSTLHNVPISESLFNHLPAALFYVLFAVCLQILDIQQYREKPLKLGLLVAFSEVISNLAEQIFRFFVQNYTFLFLHDLLILLAVAILRSFFVVGIYSSILIAEQKKRVQEMLNIGSDLYVETLYLKKSMNHIETITASGYELYRQLKVLGYRAESLQALHIAQEIHEVKKDSQRIYAGISKIVGERSFGPFVLSELLHYIEEGNRKYAELLGKDIQFNTCIDFDFQTKEHIALLALLNNLSANAVEAIEEQGIISIAIGRQEDNTVITVCDNGQGISQADISVIFEPGYTTKFNIDGVAATGIGLSHVAELVEKLKGSITVDSDDQYTTFKIIIPTQTIQTGET